MGDIGGSEVVQFFSFVGFRGEGGNLHSHLACVLNCQMAESADTDYCAPVTWLSVSLDWNVDCQTSTKQWGCLIEWKSLRDMPCPVGVNLHMRAISSEPSLPIGEYSIIAQVRPSSQAVLALQAAFSDRTHTNNITNLLIGDARADFRDLPNDLVAWAARVFAHSPAATDGQDV